MVKPSEKQNKPEDLKRIGDYVAKGGERLEGDRVALDDILGEDIILKDFVFIPSTKFQEERKEGDAKKEFAVLQFCKQGEPKKLLTTATGGGAVVDALKQMPKQYLPILIRIKYTKSPTSGRRYLILE